MSALVSLPAGQIIQKLLNDDRVRDISLKYFRPWGESEPKYHVTLLIWRSSVRERNRIETDSVKSLEHALSLAVLELDKK